MWLVLRFGDKWMVRPYSGDMHQFTDPKRGVTRNIIAIFHREVDAKAYAQMLNACQAF